MKGNYVLKCTWYKIYLPLHCWHSFCHKMQPYANFSIPCMSATQNISPTFCRSYSLLLSRATMFNVCRSPQLVSSIIFYVCSCILLSFVLDTLQISSPESIQTLLPWKCPRPLFRNCFEVYFWVDTLHPRTTQSINSCLRLHRCFTNEIWPLNFKELWYSCDSIFKDTFPIKVNDKF